MAEIFLAEDLGVEFSRRLVVIKRLAPSILGDASGARMFRNEMRITSQLSHPNIAQVIEVGRQADGGHFLVMEFVHGEDLHDLLAHGGALWPGLAVLVALQVAAGLHHAHELTDLDGQPLRVVHRDVSPSNIRVSYEGTVKLIDFGIAKATAGSFVSERGTIKGKYAYMAPEQASGQPIDGRADQFSLGIVLHELLVGRPLFAREAAEATLHALLDGPIPAPSTRSPWPLPAELDKVVLRALDRDPEQRFQSVRHLQLALERIDRQGATSVDLERLMRQRFGDSRQRLATLLGTPPRARQKSKTLAAIPSRLGSEGSRAYEQRDRQEEDEEDELGTHVGYEPLRTDRD
jgi:serine/threonine protein kinase